MLLALDIGNTNVTCGLFDCGKLIASWRLATDPNRQSDEYMLQFANLIPMKGTTIDQISSVAICSVVPSLTAAMQDVSRSLFDTEPLVVGAGTRTGVRILYDPPRDVGADRIVDAVAAFNRYGGPSIIVDFGTATVFDAVSEDGTYLGGAIAPGLAVAAEALERRTAQLRQVELAAPPNAIGRNTIHAMQSGFVFGYVGLVESMVNRFKHELGSEDARVIATGGQAALIASQTEIIDFVDQELTLYGLQYVYMLNQGTAL